jgi:hypothetical protein
MGVVQAEAGTGRLRLADRGEDQRGAARCSSRRGRAVRLLTLPLPGERGVSMCFAFQACAMPPAALRVRDGRKRGAGATHCGEAQFCFKRRTHRRTRAAYGEGTMDRPPSSGSASQEREGARAPRRRSRRLRLHAQSAKICAAPRPDAGLLRHAACVCSPSTAAAPGPSAICPPLCRSFGDVLRAQSA